jgi:spore cortex formation protein SpoVR/YcgB (stage V sporulation)
MEFPNEEKAEGEKEEEGIERRKQSPFYPARRAVVLNEGWYPHFGFAQESICG